MNDHERVHIDGLVHEACDLLCETAIARCAGPTNALRVLRDDPNGDGVWLDRFTVMFLGEHALDTTPGACAILECFERRPMPAMGAGGTVAGGLQEASRAVFADMVRRKADEALERASMQEGVPA